MTADAPDALPERGLSADELQSVFGRFAADDVDWRHGRGWSLVYDAPGWHHELVQEASNRFADENALSHAAFPSARHFESAVVGMAASVAAPGVRAYGVFTSGGTESTMIAMKAYRDRAGRDDGVIVVPATAHPAFGKAAAYLRMEVVTVPVGDDGVPDPDELLAAVDDRTLVVGLSAPCYPFGVVDPIEAIASRLAERGVGVHVDAAMGGFFLPFLDAAGVEPPRFGLDVAGVTSVAVDVHKYGYGAKGASVALFATQELRHHAYHVATGWPGGAYASPGVLGTRPVAAAAAAYTAIAALGRNGYRALVADVMDTTRTLQAGLLEHAPLTIVGAPPMGVFAAAGAGDDIAGLAHGLGDRGWWIDAQTAPPALHFIVFPRHAEVVERFLADVRDISRTLTTAGPNPGGPLASYGVMVRGGTVDDSALLAHLDERFDEVTGG
jgi:glutamate/tyrosine decarboxylase-like PLP-dependent enzyme